MHPVNLPPRRKFADANVGRLLLFVIESAGVSREATRTGYSAAMGVARLRFPAADIARQIERIENVQTANQSA